MIHITYLYIYVRVYVFVRMYEQNDDCANKRVKFYSLAKYDLRLSNDRYEREIKKKKVE